jgi:hypothetical protein
VYDRRVSSISVRQVARVSIVVAGAVSGALVVVAACSGGSSGPTDETAFGKACGCPDVNTAAPGDWMCTTTYGPCSGRYFCLNGTCTRGCELDAGDAGCPTGANCKRTAKSNLAVYCATD